MGKAELRAAIFDVITFLNKYEMSDQAKKLVIYYFNESTADASFERALEAITKYCSEDLPEPAATPPRLRKLIATLKMESDAWDNE